VRSFDDLLTELGHALADAQGGRNWLRPWRAAFAWR
jgi:hypothetical protein